MNLIERIDAQAAARPERLAHVSAAGRLTYGDLLSRSDALASFVNERLGDGDHSPVVVRGHKEPEMLVAFLGCVKAGHAYVPLDVSLPQQRVDQVVATSGSRLLLTPQVVQEALTLTRARIATRPPLEDDNPFYVMFTSGSTGEPKGVTITPGNLTSFINWMLSEHDFAPGEEAFLNQAPFSFDLSVMDTYLSLIVGGTLFSLTAAEMANPRLLFRALEASGVTTWVSTPSFGHLCVAEPSFDARMLPKLRRFLFCGETLPSALVAELLRRFPEADVWNTYGPTEATVATTSVRVDCDVLTRHTVLPVGVPKPDCRIVIVDNEIVVAGPNVSPGYLNRPDLTRARFFDLEGMRGYRTGDQGHFERGLLFFDGRLDDQIKLHGYRIELGDVEANLRALPDIREAVVVPLYRETQVDAIAAFVSGEIRHGETAFQTSVRVRRALSERVPAYMVPRVVQLVERFPLTPNGKIDRRALANSLVEA